MPDNKKVFIVDDDEIFLMISSVNLRDACAGVEIATATNGELGLQLLEHATPDIVLLDVNMPVLNGWEFLDRLAEKIKDTPELGLIPIYITTSSVDPDDRVRASQHPLVKGFIEKPLNDEKIKALQLC